MMLEQRIVQMLDMELDCYLLMKNLINIAVVDVDVAVDVAVDVDVDGKKVLHLSNNVIEVDLDQKVVKNIFKKLQNNKIKQYTLILPPFLK